MNPVARYFVALTFPLLFLSGAGAVAQQAPAPARRPAPTPTPKPAAPRPATAQEPAPQPELTPAQLIAQGKDLYKLAKYKPALAKFEAALKQEPENDEALGLAALTSYRLDSQPQAKDYFLKRATLPNQKDSVRAYSYYRAALSDWRIVHDLVGKFCEYQDGRYIAKIPDKNELDVRYAIDNGLDYIERTLALSKNFSEAYNVKNLLLTEAALVAPTTQESDELRTKAEAALRKAMELAKPAAVRDTADFTAPTIRVGEVQVKKEDDDRFPDPLMKSVEGGKPLKRVQPVFPSIRSSSKPGADPSDPSGTGVTSDGGAYSLGSGRGALTAAYAPGKVKVELLVATDGSVVFTHVVDGRTDLSGAAVLAARAWRFEPARFAGKPVQVSAIVTFDMKPGGK